MSALLALVIFFCFLILLFADHSVDQSEWDDMARDQEENPDTWEYQLSRDYDEVGGPR